MADAHIRQTVTSCIAFSTLDCSIVPTCGAWGSATAAKRGPLKQSWAGIQHSRDGEPLGVLMQMRNARVNGFFFFVKLEELHIHLFQEIAILEFPTSDCFQNEAICDNKLTAAVGPIGNTWWRPERHNKLPVRATGPCWLKNYNCPTI